MKTLICPTCGCSLVRLGVTKNNTVSRSYNKKEYSFCCEGCADLFDADPEKTINETKDLVVYPSCLAEKPLNQIVELSHRGETIYFCKCPYCLTVFENNAEYYINRLAGKTNFSGVVSDGHGCCNIICITNQLS